MTKEQEDKIIRQAQDILERRMAVEKDIKIDLQKVMYYGAYYLGALQATTRVTKEVLTGDKPKGEDWIYKKAEWDLITASKRNMQLFLDGTKMRYRNHKCNKKGKLESVECYFVEYRNVMTEVK
jgi:hypothetical protein